MYHYEYMELMKLKPKKPVGVIKKNIEVELPLSLTGN